MAQSGRSKIHRWVFIFFLCVYTLTAGGHYYSSDGETIYLVTRAVVKDGTFFIQNDNKELPPAALAEGVGKKSAPIVMPAQSILMVPLYLAGLSVSHFVEPQYTNYLLSLFTSFLNAIVTALTMMLFFLFLERLGYGRRETLVTTGVLGLATLVWPYSKFDFSEAVLSFFLFGGLYWAYLFRQDARYSYALWSGFFLGFAQATKVAAFIAVVPIALYFFFNLFSNGETDRSSRLKMAAVFMTGPVISAILIGIYNLARFGIITKTGYPPTVSFITPLSTGIYGLLFSTGKGLFIYSPPVIFFFAGFSKFFKKHINEAALFLALIIIGVIFYAKYMDWHGDVAWGPRYMVYLLPFIMVPAVEVVTSFSRFRLPLKTLIAAIVILGILIQLTAISVFYNTYLNGMIIKYPEKVGGNNLKKFWFDPGYSPLLGEAKLIPNRISNYGHFLTSIDYSGIPKDPSPVFSWFFLKPVPDYWWVYYSLTSMSRKWLVLLLIPMSGLFISGKRLSREL